MNDDEPKYVLELRMTVEGLQTFERIQRLADTDESTAVINALSVYWELLKIVAADGAILVLEKGKKKPQVLQLP